MKVKTFKTDNFKHSFNIKAIINSLSFFEQMKEVNYFFAGGFPVALLLAPREENCSISIRNGYYSDIDVFFPSKEDYTKAENIFNSNPEICTLISDTANATTYKYFVRSETNTLVESYHVQLVKKFFCTEQDLLKTFDIVNCSLVYNKNKELWFAHEMFLTANLNKRLTFSNPVMLNETYPDYPDSIFFQLERLAKYSKRYDLDLDVNAMKVLLSENLRHPDLDYRKNEKLICRGYYSTYSRTIVNTFNVWESFSHIFTENRHWEHFKNKFKLEKKEEEKNENNVPF